MTLKQRLKVIPQCDDDILFIVNKVPVFNMVHQSLIGLVKLEKCIGKSIQPLCCKVKS